MRTPKREPAIFSKLSCTFSSPHEAKRQSNIMAPESFQYTVNQKGQGSIRFDAKKKQVKIAFENFSGDLTVGLVATGSIADPVPNAELQNITHQAVNSSKKAGVTLTKKDSPAAPTTTRASSSASKKQATVPASKPTTRRAPFVAMSCFPRAQPPQSSAPRTSVFNFNKSILGQGDDSEDEFHSDSDLSTDFLETQTQTQQ
jgi:hypothetical protein